MRGRISLIITLLAAMLPSLTLHASPGELERYLASAAGSRDSVDVTCIESRLEGRTLAPVEGVWRISGSDGMFAVVADAGTIFYRIVVIDSPDRSVLPGTVMGACTAAGRADSYDAWLYTSGEAGLLSRPKRFTLSLADDGRLIMVPVVNKLKLNLWRLLPYMFRMSVSRVNDRPNNLDGAVRVYPEAAASPLTPRYL